MTFNFQPSGVTSQGTYTPDNLLAGDFDIFSKPIVIKSGSGVLPRGTVLQVSATPGKYEKVTTDANAKYILVEDIDATSADVTTGVFVTGIFNDAAVTIGAGATLAGVKAALEPLSIFLVSSVA